MLLTAVSQVVLYIYNRNLYQTQLFILICIWFPWHPFITFFLLCALLFSGILLHIQLAVLWSTLGPLAFYRVDLVIEHTNTRLAQACQCCVTQLVHDCIFDILTSTYSNFVFSLSCAGEALLSGRQFLLEHVS